MEDDADGDDDAVTVDDFDETKPKYQCRRTASGIQYWIPDPSKKVIWLEEDCGLLLFDPHFFAQVPGYADRYMPDGDPIDNDRWKKYNVLKFRRRLRLGFKPLQ